MAKLMKTFMNGEYEICDAAARSELENKAAKTHTHAASDITGVLPIERGGTGNSDRVEALHALGIHWGTDEPEEYWRKQSKYDKKNTIYIKLD